MSPLAFLRLYLLPYLVVAFPKRKEPFATDVACCSAHHSWSTFSKGDRNRRQRRLCQCGRRRKKKGMRASWSKERERKIRPKLDQLSVNPREKVEPQHVCAVTIRISMFQMSFFFFLEWHQSEQFWKIEVIFQRFESWFIHWKGTSSARRHTYVPTYVLYINAD